MYITKIIENFGSLEMMANSINNECEEMYKQGYELVCYIRHQNTGDIIATLKKIIKICHKYK